jgi:hypothetical protein
MPPRLNLAVSGMNAMLRIVGLLASVLSLSVAPAFAQVQFPESIRLDENSRTRQILGVSLAATEGYDDNLSAEAELQPTTPFQTSGFFTALAPRLDFASRMGKARLGLTASSDVRYYSPLQQVVLMSAALGTGIHAQLAKNTTLFANEDVVYAPAFLYRLFPQVAPPTAGELSAAAPNYALASNSYSSTTTMNLTHRLDRKTTVSFGSDLQFTRFVHNINYPDARSVALRPEWAYSLTRNVRLKALYTAQFNHYAATQRITIHTVQLGAEYERPLSKSRRMAVGFTVGPLIENSLDFRSGVRTRRQGVGGDLTFDRQFSRTWFVRAGAHRGVQFTEVLATPVITNGGTVAVTGRLFGAAYLEASTSYTDGGTFVFGPAHLTTYAVDLLARFNLSRTAALFVQGMHYEYVLTDLQPLLSNIPPDLKRNAFRVGVITALPVWRR